MKTSYSELFKRNEGIFSETEQDRLKKSRVLIVGTGGVGGAVAVILARTGIQNFILIDFDTFDASNVNRQIGCFTDTIGRYKAEVIAEEIKRINPEADVEYHPRLVPLNEIEKMMDRVGAVMGGADDFAFSICVEKMARERGLYTLLVIPSGTWAHVVVTKKGAPSILDIEGIPETESYDELKALLKHEHFKHARSVYTTVGSWSQEYFDRFIKEEVKPTQICPSVWLASSLGARELSFAIAGKRANISPYYWEIHNDRFIKKNAYFSHFTPHVLARRIFLGYLLRKERRERVK